MHRIIYLIANSAERKIRQIRHQIKKRVCQKKQTRPLFLFARLPTKYLHVESQTKLKVHSLYSVETVL